MSEKLIRWYVFPHTHAVNDRIRLSTEGHSFLFNGDVVVHFIDGREEEKPVWEVPRHIIKALNNEKRAKGRFTVFVQEGNGDIREFDPEKSKKLHSAAATKEPVTVKN